MYQSGFESFRTKYFKNFNGELFFFFKKVGFSRKNLKEYFTVVVLIV